MMKGSCRGCWLRWRMTKTDFFLVAGGSWLVEAKRSEEIRLWDFKEKSMVSSLFSMQVAAT